MATLFMDGFDYYTTADILKKWTSLGATSTATVGALYARQPSGQGCSILTGNTPGLQKTFGANYVQGVAGFAFQAAAVTSRQLLFITDGAGTEQISIRTNSSGVLTVNRGATVLGTGTTVLSVSVWYYIELKFLINNTTGYFGLHLNGGVEIATSASNQNTRSTANNQWNGVLVQPATNQAAFLIDDLYVLDTSTGTNTDYLGTVRVATIYPATPGNYTQWTPNGGVNVGNVSEPYEDGDVSFNQSGTATQKDTFIFGQLPSSTGSVFAVQHVLTARQDSGAARTISAMSRRAGSDYVSARAFSLSTTYQQLLDVKDLDPAAGPGAWTVTNFNATEFGYDEVS